MERVGASAVEFVLILPVLVIFVFGIIGFGVAFMQMQTIRGALREGGRAAATGASADEVQDHAFDSALGAIDSAGNVEVHPNTGGDPVCTAQTIGRRRDRRLRHESSPRRRHPRDDPLPPHLPHSDTQGQFQV